MGDRAWLGGGTTRLGGGLLRREGGGPEGSRTRSPRRALAPDFGSAGPGLKGGRRAQRFCGAGMQGCSTHLVHLGYHLIPPPHPEAQQVVKLLRVPQALHELHVDGTTQGLGDQLANTSGRHPTPGLGSEGAEGGAGTQAGPVPPRPLPAHLNGPRALEPLPVGL